MHVLRYLDELRPTDDIPEITEAAKQRSKLEPEEISLAKMLVDKFSSKHLDFSAYSDTYSQELEKLIEAKRKGKPIITKSEHKQKVAPDLLEALKASVHVKSK